MVKLPDVYAATWYPGYFFHLNTHVLYSLKIDGILKPLKKVHPNAFNQIQEPGYRVSYQGKRKFMPMSKLIAFTKDHRDQVHEIPVRK